jgi:hypothetical protein
MIIDDDDDYTGFDDLSAEERMQMAKAKKLNCGSNSRYYQAQKQNFNYSKIMPG